jgi:cell division protein FtsL
MSAVAATRARGQRKSHARTGTRGGMSGIVWIVLLAVLLAGVVAINVLVLQLNVRFDALGRERAQLKADIATAQAQLSSASASALIQRRAAAELGLEPADPEATTYVRLGR